MTRAPEADGLRRLADHLATAQRIARIGSWETDVADDTLTWSDEVFRIFGTTPDAFGGTLAAFLEYLPPDDRAQVVEAHRRVLESGEPLDLQHRIIRPSGEVRHVHERGERIVDERGVRIAGTVQDVTDHVRSVRQFEGFFDLSVDLMCLCTFEGTFLRVNRAMAHALGCTADELCRTGPLAIVHPGDLDQTRVEFTRLKGGAVLRGFVNRCRRSDDTYRMLSWSAQPVLEERLIYMVARDVTEETESAQRLRDSEERFRELAETIEDVFWIWDTRSDRIVYVSPSYETTFGQSRESLYADSQSFHRAIDPVDLPRLHQALERDPYTVRIDYRIVRPDGDRRWIGVRTFPVRDADGRVLRVVGTGRDITQIKATEDALLRSQRLESIGTLAGGVAHDINNVLAPILMATDVLHDMAATQDERDLIATIRQSAERGANMVKQVLSFARGVEGQRSRVHLRHLIADVSRLARDTFDRRITLETEVDDGLWPVEADPTQLHQVLVNLCVNARDAMPNGGHLRIRASNVVRDQGQTELRHDAAPGRFVCLTVADTGHGVPESVRPRIFDPFFTTKPHGEGTGLGLSTAHAIVSSHGGSLTLASSAADTGSVFEILLPAMVSQAEHAPVHHREKLPRGEGELILVVDDEPSVRFVARETLESFNYRVLLAAHGEEAVKLLADANRAIAATVTDMMMPVLDGFGVIEAAARLRPGMPVIASSGLDVDGLAARARSAGARVFLSKPFTAATLLRTLAETLAPGRTGEEALG